MSKLKGEVSVEADGQRYTLAFSINALCKMEDMFGEAVGDIATLGNKGKRFNTMRNVFWCALADHHPDLTVDDAGRIITEIGIAKADELVGEAFALAFPEVKASPLAGKPAGKRSGRTG